MADQHPIYQRPVIHCGMCQNPLIFPWKKEAIAAAPHTVLAECTKCGVAVQVPKGMLTPLSTIPVDKTEARPVADRVAGRRAALAAAIQKASSP